MKEIIKLINDSKKIIIMTHETPDGDAIGSAMGLFHFLKGLDKVVTVLLPEVPPVFNFIEDIDKVVTSSNDKYDLAIVVDCASYERIGGNTVEFNNAKKRIVIDHHVTNTKYGDVNYVKDAVSSCAQVIYYLLKGNKCNINKRIATSLMVGVLTDTNGFSNDNVDSKTFTMCADMMKLGVDIHDLYRKVLLIKNTAQMSLMKIALDRLEFFGNGKVAFSYITKDDFDSVGAKLGDHEGLVDIGRNIHGVIVSIFVREDNGYRISFRSNGVVNVNKIAKRFNGGGHSMAAGAKVTGELNDIKIVLINETLKEINN